MIATCSSVRSFSVIDLEIYELLPTITLPGCNLIKIFALFSAAKYKREFAMYSFASDLDIGLGL